MRVLPRPGSPNSDLGQHRAADHRAEVDGAEGDHGGDGAAQRVPGDDGPLPHAVGAEGADVVLGERLQDRRCG